MVMITKKILDPNRLRRIDGGFSFIPHRFVTDGFLSTLRQKELLLYLFLILVSDRNGLSFYSYDAICSLLGLSADDYIETRDGLIEKDLIAVDGTIFQVLDLPSKPVEVVATKLSHNSDRRQYCSQIKSLIQQSLWEAQGGE